MQLSILKYKIVQTHIEILSYKTEQQPCYTFLHWC